MRGLPTVCEGGFADRASSLRAQSKPAHSPGLLATLESVSKESSSPRAFVPGADWCDDEVRKPTAANKGVPGSSAAASLSPRVRFSHPAMHVQSSGLRALLLM